VGRTVRDESAGSSRSVLVRRGRAAGRLRVLAALVLVVSACASAPSHRERGAIAVVTPADGIPVRSPDVYDATGAERPPGETREAALAALREELAGALTNQGFEVVGIADAPAEDAPARLKELAARAGESGAGEVLVSDLLVYGDFRKSWIWALGAQALAAGIAHGVVVAAATGDSGLGWWAGSAEFLLESVVWVGGAVFGSRAFDPVLVRARLVRVTDGKVEKRWFVAGTRPPRLWLRRRGRAPRADRLRGVARTLFDRLARRLARRADRLARGQPSAGSASRRAIRGSKSSSGGSAKRPLSSSTRPIRSSRKRRGSSSECARPTR